MSSQRIPRANPHLTEALEMLDMHLYRYSGDIKQATACLNKVEIEFVDAEIEHCIRSPRYYLENYHVVQTEDQGFKTLFPFWESQEIFYLEVETIWLQGKQVKVLVLKARQQGISTISQGLCFHKTIFTEACNTIIIAQDPSQADFLFSMSRLAYDHLPWWMKPEERYQSKGRYLVFDKKDDNERALFPGLRSQIIVDASNKVSSGGPGRGKTLRAAHYSELSAWSDGGVLAKALFPAMNAQDGLYIMESTALGRKGFFYKFWRDCEKGGQDWNPVFIEYFRTAKKYSRPIASGYEFVLTEEEKAIRSRLLRTKNFRITDETFNWRRMKIREFVQLTGDEFGFYAEYASNSIEAFQGSGLCAFPKKMLQRILESHCEPPRWFGEIEYKHDAPTNSGKYKTYLTESKDGAIIPQQEHVGGRLYVWEKPDPEENYYLACDVSQGVEGGDYSCIQVLRIGRGRDADVQVAEWHGWINPTPLGHMCAALGYWYNNAQIAVECNDVGATTNNELFRVLEYENIYRWKHTDKIKNFMTDFFGWYTNHKTRPIIITKTREALMENTLILRSAALVDQMLDFSSDDGGRFEGQDENDDRVFALMIARYCAHESDYGKDVIARAPARLQQEKVWQVFDPKNRLFLETKDYDEGFVLMSCKSGWSMRPKMEINRKVWIVLQPDGKKVMELDDFEVARRMALENKWTLREVDKISSDFHNTDYSPVHDVPGLKQDLFRDGVKAEHINHEVLLHAQLAEGNQSDEDMAEAWKNI